MIVRLIILLGLMNYGCSQRNKVQDITITVEDQIIPYLTATSSPLPKVNSANMTPKPSSTFIPTPTSTPFVYEVVENDTLIGIAFSHSIPLEEIIAANPEIDPNFLTIGMTLTIPLEGDTASVLPVPTPISIEVQQPVCYNLLDGTIQCMSVVKNNQEFAVENVAVMISLESSDGVDYMTQIGIMPQNIIPSGKSAAVSAAFESPLRPDFITRSSLLSAIPVSSSDEQRYLSAEVDVDEIKISPNGQSAYIAGSVVLASDQPNASSVWVSAFAYDSQNNVVGIRKWIAGDLVMDLSESINFNMDIYSLGNPIDHIEVLTEVRP